MSPIIFGTGGAAHNTIPQAQACAPSHPALRRGEWNRKFGRYDFHRFDHIVSDQASVGGASIGKVQIDCKFLFRKSKWGSLEAATPAGIIYMDINFHQPQDYKLVYADIQVVLEDPADGSRNAREAAGRASVGLGLPVQMTNYFGPECIVGPERIQQKAETLSFEPNIEAMGVGVGGMGGSQETSFEVSHRWKFTGRTVPEAGNSHYRTLQWTLEENKLEPGQNSKVHTAFAFRHDGREFLMKVKVCGRLRRVRHRLKETFGKAFKFGPSIGRPQDVSSTLVGAYIGLRRPLDGLASSLREAMEMENHQRRTLELPKPQQATFYEAQRQPALAASAPNDDLRAGTHAGADDQASSTTPGRVSSAGPSRAQLHASPPAALATAHDELGPSLPLAPDVDERLNATLADLARAGRRFTRSAAAVEILQDDVSEHSRLSSEDTVVGQTEQPVMSRQPIGQAVAVGPKAKAEPTAEEARIAEMQRALVGTVRLWVIVAYRILLELMGIWP